MGDCTVVDASLSIMTDCAGFWIFDPAVVAGYPGDDLDTFGFANIEGVQQGEFTGFSLGGDGVYRIRVTDGELTQDERDYAAGILRGLRVRVTSGKLCIGGYGFQNTDEGYASFALEPGLYAIDAHEILWDVSPRWRREDGPVPEDAPPDFVLLLRRQPLGGEPYELPERELRLDTLYLPFIDEEPFAFPSTTREVGTQPGTVLTSMVIKSPKAPHGFRLKDCGIEGYKAELDDYTGLEWQDKVRFRVTGIDHEAMLYRGVLVEKLDSGGRDRGRESPTEETPEVEMRIGKHAQNESPMPLRWQVVCCWTGVALGALGSLYAFLLDGELLRNEWALLCPLVLCLTAMLGLALWATYRLWRARSQTAACNDRQRPDVVD